MDKSNSQKEEDGGDKRFGVQFGINSMSEWLLIAGGEAKCNYANYLINPKLLEKTCYWMLITNLAKLAVHYNYKYEHAWDRQVYGILVYGTLYILQQNRCYLQVYKFIADWIVHSKLQ